VFSRSLASWVDKYGTGSGSDRMLHSTLAALLNYRTVSGSDRLVSGTLSIVGRQIRNGER
jgi:hypothetical protein